MKSCVPTAITKSVLIAGGGTVGFATMICHGRLVGSAKKKPVNIVLNITVWVGGTKICVRVYTSFVMIVCRVVNTLEYVERRDVRIDNSLPKDTTRSTL